MALSALGWVLGDGPRAERLLSLTGLTSDELRAGLGDPALLGAFFDGEMHRQSPILGAVGAIKTLQEHADVVVLTNLADRHNAARQRQLADHGLDLRVFTNQGPKGPALQAIMAEYSPSKAVFIDDLAQHHGSAAEIVPQLGRLHLCGEPTLAPHITCGFKAGHAHARIDTWDHALPWLLGRIGD